MLQADAGAELAAQCAEKKFCPPRQAIFSAPHTPDGLAHDYRLILDRAGGDRT